MIVRRIVGVLAAVATLLFATLGAAQVVIHSDPYATSGGSAYENLVRDGAGVLHTVSIQETPTGSRELVLHSSSDGGASWQLDPFILNDLDSGLEPPEPTNVTAVAIDDEGTLHVTWGRYYYPSFYQQFYRQYDPVSGDASAIIDISGITGAAPTSRTAAMDVAVDADGTIWLVAHGPSSWVERLLQSTVPYATDLTFNDVGSISPSFSAQNSRLAVDLAGRIHASYYRNTGAGNYEHRIYDPVNASWSPSVVLGNVAPTNDLYGALAADALGQVHALFVVDSTAGETWQFLSRTWDEVGGWGLETPLFSATPPQYDGIANYRIFALATDESTGTLFTVYRDLSDGAPLRVATLEPGEPSFTILEDLQPESSGLHEYYVPTLRGTLWPEFNRTGLDLHVTFQNRPPGAAENSFVFQAPSSGSGEPQFRRGDADGNGSFTGLVDGLFLLNYQFVAGAPPPPCLKAADADDNGSFTGLVDGLYLLSYQFVAGSPPPPPPGPVTCGTDPTPDALGCDTPSCP